MNRYIKPAILSVLFLTFISSPAQAFDFCSQKCDDGKVNSRCDNDCLDKECKAIEITDEFRQKMLDYHNAHRNDVALAKVKEGRLSKSPAANMRVMQYDKELEDTIRCSIVKNGFSYDGCRGSESHFPQGQNLYRQLDNGTGPPSDLGEVGKLAVDQWFAEVKTIDNAKIYFEYEYDTKCMRFTQVIWARSYVLGCSACWFEDFEWKGTVLGCNYYEKGNLDGHPVFAKGHTASECGDLGQNHDYKGLCGASKPVIDRKTTSRAHHRLHNMVLVKMAAVITVVTMSHHSKFFF